MITSIIRLIVLIPSLTDLDQTWVIAEGSLWIIVEGKSWLYGLRVKHVLTRYLYSKPLHSVLLLANPATFFQACSTALHWREQRVFKEKLIWSQRRPTHMGKHRTEASVRHINAYGGRWRWRWQ
jgi:hypothetical protein